jgi:ubiquinone/menaquinone biosynthesis C-methylase UbiE
MSTTSTAEARKFIYENQAEWLEGYKSFVSNGKILVVGHGLGYTTEIISKINPYVEAIDVGLEVEARMKEKVTVYDGFHIPFPDKTFDVVVITYVLHHAADVSKLFDEIVRVSKSKIVILEETYNTFFQKLDVISYCWYFNRKAGQNVNIEWSSYLTSERILNLAEAKGLKLNFKKEKNSRSYKTELFVFTK